MTQEITELIKEINLHIETIAQNPWVWISAIATILLGLVAVYTANKELFHDWLHGPRLELDKTVETIQQGPNKYVSRMKITNRRGRVAKKVQFVIEELYYKNNSDNWERATNYIPFPLNWMHINKNFQDLHRDRVYYLDLCQVVHADAVIKINITAPGTHPEAHGINDLRQGDNKIKVTRYGDNIKKESNLIQIQWSGELEPPTVKFLKH